MSSETSLNHPDWRYAEYSIRFPNGFTQNGLQLYLDPGAEKSIITENTVKYLGWREQLHDHESGRMKRCAKRFRYFLSGRAQYPDPSYIGRFANNQKVRRKARITFEYHISGDVDREGHEIWQEMTVSVIPCKGDNDRPLVLGFDAGDTLVKALERNIQQHRATTAA